MSEAKYAEVQRKCPSCYGEGGNPVRPGICNRCHGEGYVTELVVDLDAKFWARAREIQRAYYPSPGDIEEARDA